MRRGTFLPLATIVLMTSVVSGSLFASRSPLSWDDGLRHITMARAELADGIPQAWNRFLYAGYLSEHAVDPWFLADVSYIPFTVFSDPVGLRLFSIVGIVVLLLALWRVIAPLGLPGRWEASVLLLTLLSPMFYERILLGRPFIWSSIFVLLALDASLRKKSTALAIVLALAALYSQLFIFPMLVGVGMALWYLLRGRKSTAATLAFASLAGPVAGIILHPQAQAYVEYIFTIFLQIPFVVTSVNLGSEMYPGTLGVSVPAAIIGACVLFLVGSHGNGHALRTESFHERGTTPIAIAVIVLFLAFSLAWSRIIDFLWPLQIVLLAHVLAETRPFVTDLFAVSMRPLLPGIRGGPLLGGILCVAFLMIVLRSGAAAMAGDEGRSLSHLKPVSEIPAGSRVLNPEWFFFPAFVAANPAVRFATGIDNTFTWSVDREAHDLLEIVYSPAGQLQNPVIDTTAWMRQLLEHFPGSTHLVLSRERAEHLLPRLRTTPGLHPLTQSGDAIEVFAIDPARMEAAR